MAVDNCTKRCTKCMQEKPLSEFGKKAKASDGLRNRCKACRKIDQADYYARNIDKERTRKAKFKQENPEYAKRYAAEYYVRNKAQCHAASAAWAKSHPKKRSIWAMADYYKHREDRLRTQKQWRMLNADAQTEYRIAYRKKNPELIAALKRNYKARKRDAEGSHNGEDIKRLFTLQKGKCANCKINISNGYHVDHIWPLSKGGSNDPCNLQILCPTCNVRKKDKDPVIFAQQMGRLL